jgi:hypothetical protein
VLSDQSRGAAAEPAWPPTGARAATRSVAATGSGAAATARAATSAAAHPAAGARTDPSEPAVTVADATAAVPSARTLARAAAAATESRTSARPAAGRRTPDPGLARGHSRGGRFLRLELRFLG